MFSLSSTLTYAGLQAFRDSLHDRADEVIRKAAFDVEARAKQAAPIDTGALRNSIYTRTRKESGYGAARSAAQGANGQARMLPEHERPDDLAAVVAVGAEYGVYVELGTRRMGARPFLGPAAEAVRPAFVEAMKALHP
ncbi:MAG TPA: HK97-gp10 family putative phage morphogenesis protein [Chloroflexota bacterium]|nr:HK97-gp10 family putative phage morphogenesis protein [Chloroflexota bacterium]